MIFRLSAILAILFMVASTNAQSLANVDESSKIIDFSAADWSFFHDASQNSFYIDFETVDVNLSDLKVYNEEGEVIFEDNLQGLPVNTIYELDLEGYPIGTYKVDIRTFTSVITKEITLR